MGKSQCLHSNGFDIIGCGPCMYYYDVALVLLSVIHVNNVAAEPYSVLWCHCNLGHLVAEKHRCSIWRSSLSSGVHMAPDVYSTVALLKPSCMNIACSDSCKCRHEGVRQCRQAGIYIYRSTDRQTECQTIKRTHIPRIKTCR